MHIYFQLLFGYFCWFFYNHYKRNWQAL